MPCLQISVTESTELGKRDAISSKWQRLHYRNNLTNEICKLQIKCSHKGPIKVFMCKQESISTAITLCK